MIHRYFPTIHLANEFVLTLDKEYKFVVCPALPGNDPNEKYEVEYGYKSVKSSERPKVLVSVQQKLW
jgi:hypothetical protein